MGGIRLVGENAAKRLHELAREEMKLKILNDILIDKEICKIEGWDSSTYIKDVINILTSLLPHNKI